jgi:uncharacterized membrane protein
MKNQNLMDSFFNSYYAVFLFLVVGIFFIRLALKERREGRINWNSAWQGYLNGWAIGVSAVIVSIVILLIKIGVIKG